jgi:2-oxoisovalerate dehydrogenase E2 component (dihydrolipoyl transacylase)
VTVVSSSLRLREFRMPDVGEGLTDAVLIDWYVHPGDTVADGQMICEIETAKATVQLPVPYSGVVHEIRFAAGTTVDVGAPIIVIDTLPSAPIAPIAPIDATPANKADHADAGHRFLVGYGAASERVARRRPRRTQPATAAPAVPAAPERDVRMAATPPVRKLAKNLGLDLACVPATGPNGTITRKDVQAAAVGVAAIAAPPGTPVEAGTGAGETRVALSGVQKAMATAMVSSAFTAPHATVFLTVDVTRTMKLVDQLKRDPALAGLRTGPLLLVARAFLAAIRRHPDINAAWDDQRQEIVRKHSVNLGIAVAAPRGLVVPNIKNAHTLTLAELAGALGTLVIAARGGKTAPVDMRGGTATITNIGALGVDTGTPILNPGEAAILAFGAIRQRPWVHKGRMKCRQVTTLALSFDHRIVDGRLGAQVLADVAELLEYPKRLINWS